MATSVRVTGAWTTMASSTVGQNNALAGRLHDNIFFSKSAALDLSLVRGGVFASAYTGGVYSDFFAVKTSNVSALQLSVFGGGAVIPVAGQGGYSIYNQGSVTVTLDAAHATLSRIDRVDLVIQDTTTSTGGAYLVVTNGTAAGSPTVPANPNTTTSITICTVLVPPNSTNSAGLTVTDTRTSAGILHGSRPLLPGDSLSNAGVYIGELRDNGTGIDRWNGTVWQPVWYGTSRGLMTVQKSNTTTTLTGGTEYKLLFDTPVDTCAEATFASDTLTINVTGRWRLRAAFKMTSGGFGASYMWIKLASSTASSTSLKSQFVQNIPASPPANQSVETEFVGQLTAGSTWSVWITSGITQNMDLGMLVNTFFQAEFLGP